MTKRRDYWKESFGNEIGKRERLSNDELRRLVLTLLPEIRSRVQTSVGRGNQTLRMLDLLIGSAKFAYSYEDMLSHLDEVIAEMRAKHADEENNDR